MTPAGDVTGMWRSSIGWPRATRPVLATIPPPTRRLTCDGEVAGTSVRDVGAGAVIDRAWIGCPTPTGSLRRSVGTTTRPLTCDGEVAGTSVGDIGRWMLFSQRAGRTTTGRAGTHRRPRRRRGTL